MARGFASLPPELRREYSRQGGLAVHEYGTGRQWTREQARAAGAKGNASPKRRLLCVDQDRRGAFDRLAEAIGACDGCGGTGIAYDRRPEDDAPLICCGGPQ